MTLSIIIVNYNTRHLCERCVESIRYFLNGKVSYEVIVVDNLSTDDSRSWLENYCTDKENIIKIYSDSNAGFARANNMGLKIARGKFILFLNSDTYLIDDSVLKAVEWLCSSPADIFGCGCNLLNADSTTGVSYGYFPELGTVLKEIFTNRFFRLRAFVPQRDNEINGIYKIDFPCGAFYLVKAALLNKIGNSFDENFFMYFEEADLSKRALLNGYKTMHFGKARIVHLGGGSSNMNQRPFELQTAFYASWFYYLEKHKGKIEAFMMKNVLTLYYKLLTVSLKFKNKDCSRFGLELKALKSAYHHSTINSLEIR